MQDTNRLNTDPNTFGTFWDDIGIDKESGPEIEFTLIDPKTNNTFKYYRDHSHRLRSRGKIHTPFELHNLMYKSLNLVSPKLVFAPDFPSYLLHEDDPKYLEEFPTIAPQEVPQMPHHREDLYNRVYDEYKSLEKVPAPIVTWGTVRQEPGGTEPFRGTQERKPRDREMIAMYNPEFKKYYTENQDLVSKYGTLTDYIRIKGQAFDNLVQYNVWTRSSWEAEELSEWMIEYLKRYTGMFREAGIVEMWFDRRVRDDTLIQIKSRYHLRSFLYYYRTEVIDLSTILPIKKINVSMDINTSIGSDAGGVNNNEFTVEDVDKELLRKWHEGAFLNT